MVKEKDELFTRDWQQNHAHYYWHMVVYEKSYEKLTKLHDPVSLLRSQET